MSGQVHEIGKAEDFEAIRTGVRRFVVAHRDPAMPPFAVGDLVFMRHGDRSTCVQVELVQSVPGDFWIYGIGRAWTQADGGLEEDMLAQLERACAVLRERSHPPYDFDEQRDAAQDIRNKATLLHLGFGGYRARKTT